MASVIRLGGMARRAALYIRCSTRSTSTLEGGVLERTGTTIVTPQEACRQVPGVFPELFPRESLLEGTASVFRLTDMARGAALYTRCSTRSTSTLEEGGGLSELAQPPAPHRRPADIFLESFLSCTHVTDSWGKAPFTLSTRLGVSVKEPIGKAEYCSMSTSGARGPICSDGLPLYVDWVSAGAVTEVLDQGGCGCCWACAAVTTIEAVNFQETGRLLKLSVQQLVDCVDVYCDGCTGGSPDAAYAYVIDVGGIVEDSVYPYQMRENEQFKPFAAPAVTIDDFVCLDDITEFELKCLVAAQPVAVAIGADPDFMRYTHGTLDGPNYTLEQFKSIKFKGSSIGHYVAVVGYGVDYLGGLWWMVKNSYGKSFGQHGGYVFLARENGKCGGAFGIARRVVYPLKSCANRYCFVRSESAMGLTTEEPPEERELSQ